MKKKNLLLAALALTALAGCSDDTFVGDQGLQGSIGTDGAINFDMKTPAITRADDKVGADAATDLNNQFIVWGEKNEAGTGAAAGDANLVFKNYIVNYAASTAYTTTSNTKNWEYVGFKFDDSSASPSTASYSTNVTPNTKGTSVVDQTIKYWDYGATKYTFTAVSALPADISAGKVTIKKNTEGASSSDFNKGYEIEVKTDASLNDIFVADRNVINQGTGKDRTATNAYGGNVTMRFRNFMSKIRFGIYETIPGYKVKITNVRYNNADHSTSFGVDGKFLTVGNGTDTHTKFTVTYENSSNKAVIDVQSGAVTTSYFETAPADEVTSGTPSPQIIVPILSADYIGTTPTTATFDKTEKVTSPARETPKVYTTVLPFTTNDANIKLQIDYKLISLDTNEEINITGKTAEIPAAYCQWKSNYAYSYIFKITDDGLYPITFDAVEVVDENGDAEYITTVTEPSITTFGVTSTGAYSYEKDEYQTGTDIYATFVKGGAVQTPSLTESTKANYVQIYQVTSSDAIHFPITEASVAESLAETPSGTAKITCTNITESTSTDYFADGTKPAEVSSVPAEDGTTKTIAAVKLDNVKTNTYAIEFVTYVDITSTLTSGDDLTKYYTLSSDVYTAASGTYASSGTYYKQVKTYKIIKVVE